MCEFCVRHGDGEKWYLQAKNYAGELLHDARRAKYVEDFIPEVTAKAGRWLRVLDRANRVTPRLAQRVSRNISRKLQEVHFGQVVPIEDVAAILAITGQVVRLPCVCRTLLEKKERAVCYLVAASPDHLGMRELIGRREEAAPFVAGMERVAPEAALAEMTALEDKGAIHTVWTFITPFIGGVCNCEPSGCLAMNYTRRGLPLYFPGEEKAAVDATRCTGCGSCLEACQFAAFTLGGEGVTIDAARCHGCGICRRRCPERALSLVAA
ncbi:MAG TPA: 4Fe-4S binding protein [Candidatus Methanoperedens sp.]|nr:4Fe-4S binding protein [Candidatus Methanoperedens sp.]